MQLIQHQILSSPQSTITISSVPQGFTDLLLVFSLRANNASYAFDDIGLRLNGDSASNYSNRILRTRDGSVGTFGGSGSSITLYGAPSAGATANTFGYGSAYIADYTSSSVKSINTEGYGENNSASAVQGGMVAAQWSGTVPITSLTIVSLNGWDFVVNSSVTLYGIKKGSDGIVAVS